MHKYLQILLNLSLKKLTVTKLTASIDNTDKTIILQLKLHEKNTVSKNTHKITAKRRVSEKAENIIYQSFIFFIESVYLLSIHLAE